MPNGLAFMAYALLYLVQQKERRCLLFNSMNKPVMRKLVTLSTANVSYANLKTNKVHTNIPLTIYEYSRDETDFKRKLKKVWDNEDIRIIRVSNLNVYKRMYEISVESFIKNATLVTS